MIIKYCPKCSGRPYTEDFLMISCPCCNSALSSEMINNAQDLAGRTKIGGVPVSFDTGTDNSASASVQDNVFGGGSVDPFSSVGTAVEVPDLSGILNTEKKHRKSKVPAKAPEALPKIFETSTEDPATVVLQEGLPTTIRGKITQYSSTGKEDGEYRRLFPVKVYQAIVYRQRLEDVLHRFTVKVERKEDMMGYQDYIGVPVNVHGTISGGLQLVDNAEVEVHGKYSNGVLMADSIYVISNGYKNKVGFQRSIRAITNGILIGIILAIICYVGAVSDLNFFDAVKKFSIVWLVFSIILIAIYALFSLRQAAMLFKMFSDKKRTFPLIPLLLVAEVLAFLFVIAFGSFAGFGTFVLNGIAGLILPVIIIVGILFAIKIVLSK